MILQGENKSFSLSRHFSNSAKILHMLMYLLCIISFSCIKTDEDYENVKALRWELCCTDLCSVWTLFNTGRMEVKPELHLPKILSRNPACTTLGRFSEGDFPASCREVFWDGEGHSSILLDSQLKHLWTVAWKFPYLCRKKKKKTTNCLIAWYLHWRIWQQQTYLKPSRSGCTPHLVFLTS